MIEFIIDNKSTLTKVGLALVAFILLLAYPSTFVSIYNTGKDFGRSLINGLM
ncbi:hypothetical protein FC86_GL001191 [Holzapfeliella floricola DSM 23037 = JCM 16512]|uniref:Bacteriocin n=1 Tax=Holzapfeliella floricola DSM 23037 = JCM 16512 TaxID=1423744 RepID=A0A0R2DKX4_9LACO|nr:hypothetical protein FC86_GL001191 [Holzapfeliella floricola DSM 23037 = JCM 16512]